MAKSPQLVIDIGQQQIKILQLKTSGKGGVGVVKAGRLALPVSPNADQDEFYLRVGETLPILLQQLDIKEKRAIVSLPGRAAFTRRLKVPVVRGRQLDRIIRYEARQHIPFPLEQINMDYQASKTPEDILEMDVNLVAVRREFSDGYSKILKKCGIRSDILDAAPLCIYNAYASSQLRNPEEVTAIVCIGASSMDIVIEQNGSMQFMRSAPTAGASLTALLAKKFDISLDEAEQFKTKPAADYQDDGRGITPEKVSSTLEQGFERIVTEIRKSFDFYVSQAESHPVTRILVCGGTAKMEGTVEFLEDRLGVPVSFFDASSVEGVTIPDEYRSFLKNEPCLIGMALRAGGKSFSNLSFSPSHIKQRLELERRAPMLSLMALLLVVMLAGAIYFLNTMLNTRRQALAQASMIVNPGITASSNLRKVRDEQDNYNERFEKINQVAVKRGNLTRIFLEVQRLIPEYVWLESIELTSSKMTIKGRALNDEKIAAYIKNLYMSPFFDNNAVVYKEADIISDPLNPAQTQIQFTIDLIRFNKPSEEEISFVNDLRSRTQETTILLVKFEREKPDDNTSPSTALLGVFAEESVKEEINLLSKVFASLVASKDETVKMIEIRFHNRGNEEVRRIQVSRESIAKFKDGRLSQEDFEKEFTLITPSPSPTPSPTPTPDLEDAGASAGMYGMYGMMGGMMGGVGGGAAAAPAEAPAAGGVESVLDGG
ncbi:MAG: type IV pilus assembly protein PilM [Candidatus Omnitrophota bacterium]